MKFFREFLKRLWRRCPFSYRELLDLAPGHVIQQVQVDLVLGLVREA